VTLTGSKSSTLVPNGTEDHPFLIELTAKRWKGLILLAILLGFAGMFLFFWQAWTIVYRPLMEGGFIVGSSPLNSLTQVFTSFTGVFGCLLLIAAVVIGFYARVMAWWRHG